MYQFIDIDERVEDRYTSSVAMEFNGEYIEDIISNYSTLNVDGRETLSYNIELQDDISGRDGGVVFDKTLPPRVISIEYELKTKSSKEMQDKYKRLNDFLDTEGEVPIRFLDEPGIVYYGQVRGMEAPPTGLLNVVSRFDILCSDPYKYEDSVHIEGNPATAFLKSTQAIKPMLIDVLVKGSIDKLTIRNNTTGRRIILNGNYKNGDRIQVDIRGNKVLKNGQDITKDLDYVATDFHSFKVKDRDVISVVPSKSELKVFLRSRWK